MKKFITKLYIFLGIIFIMLYAMDRFYTRHVLDHPNVCEKSEWILNHRGESFDFAFLGNSRVMHMIDINVLEDKTKKNGINLGLRGANFAESFLLLDQFLKKGNSIKNLIIEVDMHNLNSGKQLEYPFHDLNYVYALNDPIVENIFKDNVPGYKLFLWKYIPFVRYMEFSSRFVLYKMIKGGFECKTSDVYDKSKGSDVVNDKVFGKQSYHYVYWTTNQTDRDYFDKIVEFAAQKNINIIVYTAPVYYKYQPYQLNYAEMIKEVGLSINKRGIPFWNFSKPENTLCRDTSDFNDNFHMNVSGVNKLSLAMADSLKQVLK